MFNLVSALKYGRAEMSDDMSVRRRREKGLCCRGNILAHVEGYHRDLCTGYSMLTSVDMPYTVSKCCVACLLEMLCSLPSAMAVLRAYCQCCVLCRQ